MQAFSKEALMRPAELRRKLVKLGDGGVWMRELSVGELQKLRARYKGVTGDETVALWLIAHSLADEHGARLLTDDEIPEFVKVVENGPEGRFNELLEGFQELMGLGEAALKDALGN